jgi:radical SAM superfamily enzyme YgiQ (UPF0313 family)
MPPGGLEELEDVDILVHGDGELVMPAIAAALAASEPLEGVPGITFKGQAGIINTGPALAPPDDLDAYPSPYLTGVLNLDGKDTAILLSSRGCSHACLFCITPGICRGKVRFHSVERTAEEMKHLSELGIKRFWFADPNFTEDKQRTLRLLAEKIRHGISAPFWFQTRSDLIDAELLTEARNAGADTVAFGLESGSPGVLAKTNKRIALTSLREHVAFAQSLGMEAELFSVFGLPGETVEDAAATLEFVRSLEIPIQSNSGSQQMQLYFGSAYTRNPDRFGFRPSEGYRPQYLSVGEEYETDTMSRAELRKVRNMWALANAQMERDVYFKQRLFEVLDFLLENGEDLVDEPVYYAYGAMASCALEEFGLLVSFLSRFRDVAGDTETLAELIASLSFFQESDGPAGPTDRVIFDSRSWTEGVPFTGVSGKYWDVLLGRGLLLESFEKGFVGACSGNEIQFSFVFPDDYYEEDLRGREIEVQATIRKVFKQFHAATIKEIAGLEIRNRYLFPDLDLLKSHNEILYYFALRDSRPEDLLKTPSHFLMLVHKLAKLGKREDVRTLAGLVAGNPAALTALADALAAAGKFSWADGYYGEIEGEQLSLIVKRALCLLNMNQASKALDLLDAAPDKGGLEFQETLLECLKKAEPDSKRIPSLSHHVLDLRVEAALARERTLRSGASSVSPVVHGASLID